MAGMVTAQLQAQFATQQRGTTFNQLLGDPNLPIEQFPPYLQAKAALDQAQRDLDHAVVRAPISGIATQVDSIQLGRFVMAGTPVFSVIDDSHPWVDANPKETDITNLQVGQKVTIDVDTFPEHTFHGTVEAVSPGTGAQFAILPPQNATGNWVKVVQRVPVRIAFDPDPRTQESALRHERDGRYRYAPPSHARPAARLAVRLHPLPRRQGRAMSAARTGPPAKPVGMRRAMVTVCAMTATIMQALDTTIANVALPYMQGSLSASLDQINWVLTSYIVASAIMTAPIGWIADRFGRKKLFIACAAGFTFASLLCGLAQSIEQMVAFRLLQGMFGAGLVPLSQAVMLDNYSAQERGSAMAIWGIGVMLGPIMGPTLGAWLTDNYSWHWVFLVNLPVGIVTIVGPAHLHGRDRVARAHALRLVRLHRARRRHRLAATDARPRRTAWLVRVERDHRRIAGVDRGLLLLLRPLADDAELRSCASKCSRTAITSAPACSWRSSAWFCTAPWR